MKSCFACAGLCLAALVCCHSAVSSPGDKKKEEEARTAHRIAQLKLLETLTGVFDAKIKYINMADQKLPPVETEGEMRRLMVLKGNFLQENLKASFEGKEFAGMGMISYDDHKKKFVSTWFDSISTATTQMTGTYDAEKKTFTSIGEDVDEKGNKWKARDVLKIVSEDEQLFEMYRQSSPSAAEVKVMEITYTRKK
jgi:hypothetical protein